MEGEEVPSTQPARQSNLYFRYYGISMGIVLLAALIIRMHHTGGCDNDMNQGWWLDGHWHPHYCALYQFKMSEVTNCLSQRRHVVMIGSEHWFPHANLLCQAISHPTASVPMDVQAVEPSTTTTSKSVVGYGELCSVDFFTHLYIDHDALHKYALLAQSFDKRPLVVVHQPQLLHNPDAKYKKEKNSSCAKNVRDLLRAQQLLLSSRPDSLIIQVAPTVKSTHGKRMDSDEDIVPKEERECAKLAREMYTSATNTSSLIYLSTPFEVGFPDYADSIVPQELSLVLNLVCPSSLSSCCARSTHSYHQFFTITVLVFILAVYLGGGLILVSGATFALMPHLEAANFDLQRFISVFHSIGGMALVMFYFLLADGTGYFLRVSKVYSPLLFVGCVVAVIAVGAISWKASDTSEFLSREQCNEWRGAMVLVFIALQYCDMEQVVALHLLGELLVGGVIFISGYCHFTYYWKEANFSWRRVGLVLLRMNVYPVLVCSTLGTSYGGYYLPLLLTLGFLFTTAFMASWPQMTPSNMQGMAAQGPQHVVVAVKFGFAFLLISFLPWVKDILNGLVSLPLLGPLLQSHQGSTDTLYHWLHTHRYSVFLPVDIDRNVEYVVNNQILETRMTVGGMLLGYVVSCLQAGSTPPEGVKRLRILGASFSTAILMGYAIFLFTAKEHAWSIESHSLIAVPVLISYAVLRNLSDPLQRYSSSLLSQLGSTSLWLFISSHHILLALSGSAILLLFPKFLLLNFFLVLNVFFFIHLAVTTATTTIRDYFVHERHPPVSA